MAFDTIDDNPIAELLSPSTCIWMGKATKYIENFFQIVWFFLLKVPISNAYFSRSISHCEASLLNRVWLARKNKCIWWRCCLSIQQIIITPILIPTHQMIFTELFISGYGHLSILYAYMFTHLNSTRTQWKWEWSKKFTKDHTGYTRTHTLARHTDYIIC